TVSSLEPQARGYAFEKFLKELFDANGLDGRSSFRLIGEQIDGSFEMSGETYLLEAKWTSKPVDAADLRSFNAKVEDKASWARGLFISDCGFSEEGLLAFGKGKSLVCMDGLDLCNMLQERLSLQEVLSKKVRRAAETGKPFVRLRDLF
ncbi:restriction endonuclease, partial [Vibrio sp. 10N.286.49.E1]